VIDAVAAEELRELERREHVYREGRPAPDVRGRTVILVDDGLATGATMRAAATAVRERGPSRVVVAAPVGAPDACRALRAVADDTVCLLTPGWFSAVGAWYDDFSPTTDAEVRDLLERAAASRAG
jgi:predicted phosphoribosyltransferase